MFTFIEKKEYARLRIEVFSVRLWINLKKTIYFIYF